MKVKIGEIIKDIPKEYTDAVNVLGTDSIMEPNRIRLSQKERFLLAEMTWRLTQQPIIQEYLDDMIPVGVEIQVNRAGESRCAVNYVSGNGIRAQTIVPSTFRHVGAEISYNNVNWFKQ